MSYQVSLRYLFLIYKVIDLIYKFYIFINFIILAINLAYFRPTLLVINIVIFIIYLVINLFKKSRQS